ncbi:MAG: hypothetical protein AAFS03_09015, partial [Pseudomonadota bacterium]
GDDSHGGLQHPPRPKARPAGPPEPPGRRTDAGPLASSLLEQINSTEATIVHGHSCEWRHTFLPVRKMKKTATRRDQSVIDYMMLQHTRFERVLEAGIADYCDTVDVDSDHSALWLVLEDCLKLHRPTQKSRQKRTQVAKPPGLPYDRAAPPRQRDKR